MPFSSEVIVPKDDMNSEWQKDDHLYCAFFMWYTMSFSILLFICTLFFLFIVAFINVFDNMASAARQKYLLCWGFVKIFGID